MPFDKKGGHHLNTQKAMASDKMPNLHKQSGERASGVGDPQPGGTSAASDSGDTAAGHLQALHDSMGGRHAHIHQGDDGSITTHHIGDDGMVQGPHQHDSMDAVREHLMQVMEEERQEGEGDGEPMRGKPEHAGIMSGY